MIKLSQNEYFENIKKFNLEEPFDFFIYRPCAYFVIKATYALPLRPNHFSFLALCCAIATGYFLAEGSQLGFLKGGIGILLFSVFDCCDGMIARMKGQGSRYGELIDMLVDVISNAFFFIGLLIGLGQREYHYPIQYLSLLSGFFILLDASIYNYYKKQYAFYSSQNPNGRKKEVERYKRELEALKQKKGKFFDRALLSLFLKFSQIQKKSDTIETFDVKRYARYNFRILPLWGVIAGSSHLTILALALIMNNIYIFFLFSILYSNIWLLFVTLIQFGINENIKARGN